MPFPQISTKLEPEVYEEILRIAKANNKTTSETVRLLIRDALATRAEQLTASQFQLVENRLQYIERRFSAWMAKIARVAAETRFYAEQMMLYDAEEQEKELLKEAAQKSVREFLRSKTYTDEENMAHGPQPEKK